MARLIFTQQLARFTTLPQVDTRAATLRDGLDSAFDCNPLLRSYVLDEQGHLRDHVVVFIDARRCRDRIALTDPLQAHSTVYILQALSGG